MARRTTRPALLAAAGLPGAAPAASADTAVGVTDASERCRVDTTTGRATSVGAIGAGTSRVDALALLS